MRYLFNSVFGVFSARRLLALILLALMSGCSSVYVLPRVELTDHLKNFVVMKTSKTDFGANESRIIALSREFYRHYEDEFDLLVFMAHNPYRFMDQWEVGRRGTMNLVRNAEVGTGSSIVDVGGIFGSENRLRGVISLIHPDRIFTESMLLHEIMHLWYTDLEVIPTTMYSHWGFSSVGGQLGGFQQADIRSLGDGKYSAGNFAPQRAKTSVPYSPLEMYLAGWIPPEEVPDIWVAEDGSWLMRERSGGRPQHQTDAEGDRIFTASQISTWSIEKIIGKLGPRTPNFEQSQKEFRIAFVLVTDGEEPVKEEYLDATNLFIEEFTKKGPISTWFRNTSRDSLLNFWEATRGIATLDLGDLRSFRR
ncbi:MAG: hypothetical protein F4W92_09305 [Gammaproteobacteria bacterium]|nr:hypothetical protein [Gammaproteobacteria bacterium]